ncbi:MAG: hypothetical protein IPL01_13305 [Acidobacteria bacterium]|nr:hypothetical protein [Acidobacteriota bacterium]
MQVLKAIEQYAVECSIVKVWTSEALATVTDETVRVYGGYGYSKDYPAERAYRDARITRIYEGTNEIQRILIPTRLLKGAGKDQLQNLSESISDIIDRTRIYFGDEGVPTARRTLKSVKETARLALSSLVESHGDKLSEEQEAVALAADIIIEAYAIESAILRVEKLVSAKGADACLIPTEMLRVYVNDAADRVAISARNLAGAVKESAKLMQAFERLAPQTPINTIESRRLIADSLIESGRYLW